MGMAGREGEPGDRISPEVRNVRRAGDVARGKGSHEYLVEGESGIQPDTDTREDWIDREI